MIFGRLREAGVLGINARNSEIIARWNPRRLYPRVDDKVLTKQLARAAGIAVPELLAVVDAHGDVRRVPQLLGDARSFVVKPVHGAMGNGVLVIVDRDGDRFVRSDGERLTARALEFHVSGILAGMYSLGGRVDRAMFEERLVTDPFFASVSAGGVPDVRIVVFRGVPVLAMVRLPTTESRGRANLHQGAIAVGIELATGRAVHAIHHGRSLTHHPDTHAALTAFTVPRWRELLVLAARCADALELGYIGVDLVLDARLGPVLLEANARPGLSIQLANERGLRPRLHAVESMALAGTTPEERVERALALP